LLFPFAEKYSACSKEVVSIRENGDFLLNLYTSINSSFELLTAPQIVWTLFPLANLNHLNLFSS
jgi:hypothetical protein